MENIRTETFLGSDKVIVGNKYTDLVLETLGKVYIKTGNSSRVLSDVLKLLDQVQEPDIESQTIIVGSTQEMEEMEYPGDGFFVYNTLTSTLYITYDERYVALIEATGEVQNKYVRRSGDTMTGPLEINTIEPPLIIGSSKLVNNLNVEYIGGYSADDLAKKKVDEYIYGNWTFKGKGVSEENWVFKNNVRMYGDLVTSRSITSPEFASGFGGYGWRLDADTNTLTVDYLVVRKAMRVYEMVINKISATNGSIWVSNSSKCSDAVQPTILTDSQLKSIPLWTGSEENINSALKIIKSNTYYLPIPDNGANTESTVSLSTELSDPSRLNTSSKTFINYKFIIYISNPEDLVSNPLFKGLQTLYDEALLTSNEGDDNHTKLQECIKLYYISKEISVTEWNDTEPVNWEYVDTFDKKTAFYMIPRGTNASGKLYTDLYENATSQEEAKKNIFAIYPYYKYFALDKSIIDSAVSGSDGSSILAPSLWVISTDEEEYPLFKPGDIIRCQKYADGNIKYYDALVLSQIESRKFIVQKASSVFDKYTEIHYNEDGSVKEYIEKYNTTQYSKTEQSYNPTTGEVESNSESKTVEARLDDIASGDDMIQIGNICDVQRQNAIYLTSSDDDGPFIDVISGLNRPDYSVPYDLPIYKRQVYIYNNSKKRYYLQETQPDIYFVYPITVEEKSYYGTLIPTKDSLLSKDDKYRHAHTKTAKVRLGNLDGIYNEIFGNKQPYGFGLYGENVFLTGEFYLNNGKSVVDVSDDSIMLKFKMAGLIIRDVEPTEKVPVIGLDGKPVLNENGNQVYRNKTEIYMNADQFVFNIAGNPAMKLSGLFNGNGQFQNALLDINGWIRTNGIEVGTGNGSDFSANFKVTQNGNLWAYDCHIRDVDAHDIRCYDINAISGKIGGFTLNNGSLTWSISDSVSYGGVTFNYTNKCNIGQTTNSWSSWAGVVDVAYNMISGPHFGISVKGLGVSLFSSQHSPDVKAQNGQYERVNYPSASLRAAGYFDGKVYSNSYFVGKFGCPNSDGTYTIGLYPDSVQELPDLDKIRIQVRSGLIVGYRGE